MPLKLIPDNIAINFLGKRWLAFVISISLLIATAGLLATKGLNFGIDFTGGTVIEIRTESVVELNQLRSLLSDKDFGEISLQNIGNEHDIMIRLQGSAEDSADKVKTIAAVKELLASSLGTDIDYRKVDYVGPQVGRELIMSGALSLLLAFTAILIYIWLRFEWQFGIGAIAALIHDAILTLGFFSLLNIEFNLASIAAILTVIGYSINDSVVIYDRIRENLRKYKKMSLAELLNISINSTLSRTLLTAGSTIAALLSLVIFGGEVIKGFSMAVLFGVIVGTYSSIYIAAPLLIFMNLRFNQNSPTANAET